MVQHSSQKRSTKHQTLSPWSLKPWILRIEHVSNDFFNCFKRNMFAKPGWSWVQQNYSDQPKYWSVPSCSFFLTPNFSNKKKGCLGGVHPSCSHDFGSEMGLWNSSKTARVNWTSSHTMKFIHLSTPKSRRETPFKSQHLPWLEFGALVADSKLQVRLPPKHFDKAGANRNNNLGGPKPVNVSWRM